MEDQDRPVLTIGVVAEIVGVSVQTLRLWENKGLIKPTRKGKDRYYSESDLSKLKHIKYLLHEKKLNTYGVKELLKSDDFSFEDSRKDIHHSHSTDQNVTRAGHTILIIDDDSDQINIVKTILESNDFNVITATSGKEGLAKLEIKMPDLVILDIMIPDFDGIEIFKTIKNNPTTKNTPVIFISSIPENIRHKLGIDNLNYDAFLEKPSRPSEILANIKNLLEK